jgi:hypothetical protein
MGSEIALPDQKKYAKFANLNGSIFYSTLDNHRSIYQLCPLCGVGNDMGNKNHF